MQVPLTPLRFLDRSAKYYPDKTALICGEHHISYRHFRDRVNQAANLFSEISSVDEHPPRIAFITWNCHLVVEACFAALRAPVIRVPLNARLTPADWASLINNVGAKAVVVDSDLINKFISIKSELETVDKIFIIGNADAKSLPDGFRNYESEVEKQSATVMASSSTYRPETDTVEIFFTSGTTGQPKGVLMNSRNLYLNAIDCFLPLSLTPDDIFLHALPLFHINGWGILHSMTACGGTQAIMRKFSVEELCSLIEKHKVTLTAMVPTMLNMIAQAPGLLDYDLSSLRLVQSGGAKLPPAVGREAMEKLGCEIFGSYGLTETSPVVTYAIVNQKLEQIKSSEEERLYSQRFCAGLETLDCEIRVVGDEGNEVDWDGMQIGEIMVRGNVVTDGYWQNEGGTNKAFTSGGEQWLRTGDLAVVDPDGYTHIVDRKKDLIIRGGENIASLEVEDVLRNYPSVLEAAVIPIPSEKWGEDPLAVIVTKPGEPQDENSILKFCKQNMAGFKVPARVEFIDELPKSGTGKILKREIKKIYPK